MSDRRRGVGALLITAIVLAACGGSDDTSQDARPATTTTVAAEPRVPDDTTPVDPSCDLDLALGALPLRQRLGQQIVVGVDPAGTADFVESVVDHGVGGVFIPGNPTELITSGLLTTTRAERPLGLWVMVDDEGGRVQRLDTLEGSMPSARDQAADLSEAEVRDLARSRGEALVRYGIDVNLAPVLDLSDRAADEVIGDRSYSNDPDVAATYAGAFADGLAEAGVLPVFKHFPGHGRASGDSHRTAVTTPALDDLADDLAPYRALLGTHAGGVMLGHLIVPDLTDGVPATVSPEAVALLRDDLGFEGVVMTDDLASMRGITDLFDGDSVEAGVAALAAGVDVLLFVDADVPEVLDRLEAAVADGTIAESDVNASVARVLRTRGLDPCDLPV